MTMLLGPMDPLPPGTGRIPITGASGAGKSTLRETIGTVLGLPTVEIDALHHGPHWIDGAHRKSPAVLAEIPHL